MVRAMHIALRLALASALTMGVASAVELPAASLKWPQVEVDQIEILGVTSVTQADVESSMELSAGDRLDRAKVVRTARNLQTLYRSRGYYEVSIQSELVREENRFQQEQIILRFTIAEGRPTRIRSIRLMPAMIRDSAFLEYWKKLESTLAGRIGISPGDIYDQEKVSAGKRGLQDVLASEEFIGAKADEVKSQTVVSPSGDLASLEAAQWVDLEFQVDLGDKVTFGFRGNDVLNKSDLMTLIKDQRQIGLGKDYVGAIRNRILEEYRTLGYSSAEVTPFTFEDTRQQERHITYIIKEGPRTRIESVEFDGNEDFGGDPLKEKFFELATKTVQKRYYVERDVEKGAQLIIEWMKSQGYLGAKLVTVGRSYTPGGGAVNLTIYLYEGTQTLIEAIEVSGVSVFSREEVLELLKVKEGSPLNLFVFSEGIEAVKAAYRARGHLDISVANEESDEVVLYSAENRLARIRLVVNEAPQFRLNRVEFEGLTSVKEYVVLRELVFQKDEVLNDAQIAESEANLRRLGLFSQVSVKVFDESDRPGFKNVRIMVQEGTPGVVAGGVGFRNDLGLRAFGQTSYSNLLGRNHTATLSVMGNRRFEQYKFLEGQAQISYLWPWIFLGETDFRPSFTVSKFQYFFFSASTIAGSATLDRKLFNLFRKYPLRASLTYSIEGINQFDVQVTRELHPDLDEGFIQIGSITPGLSIDMRDNALSPTKGVYATSSFEWASPYFGSQQDPFPIGYTKFQGRIDGHVPLPQGINWYVSFRTGIERNTEKFDPTLLRSGQIPPIKQFALGGLTSVRGFKEQSIVADKRVRGTLTFVNYRTQIDFPIAANGQMRAGPFIDAANLLSDLELPDGSAQFRYSFTEELRTGAGFGLRYLTPVGPVSFDWGFNLDPRPDEDSFRFHLSVGYI